MNRLVTACAPLLFVGCTASVDPTLCLGSTCVAVATSIYNADFTGQGTLNSVDLATKAPRVGLDATLDPDTSLKIVGEELFVLMRTTGALRIYDPKSFAVKLELPIGDAAHPGPMAYPTDFHIGDGGKIYVTLSGNDAEHAFAVLDRTAPGTISYLALPQDAADGDGKPEPAKIHECDGKLYVTLQSYSFGMTGLTYAKGRIAIIDPDARVVRGVITLAGENPFDLVPLGGDCNDVVVASAAGLTTVPDGKGGLERVDLSAGASKGVLVSDQTLGGRPTLLAPAGDDLLYVALYSDPQPNGMGAVYLSSVKVVAFDPKTKSTKGDVTGNFGNVNFLRVHDDQLFLGAGIYANKEVPGKAPRGLYVGPATGSMIPATPIDLQLTPSAIALP